MTIAQDLKALNKDIQSLGKTLDRLLMAVEKDKKSKAKPTKKIAAKKAPAKEAKVDYSKMTVAELKAAAKDKGISGYTSLKKAELIAALNQ